MQDLTLGLSIQWPEMILFNTDWTLVDLPIVTESADGMRLFFLNIRT